jgi:hypothetical protein
VSEMTLELASGGEVARMSTSRGAGFTFTSNAPACLGCYFPLRIRVSCSTAAWCSAEAEAVGDWHARWELAGDASDLLRILRKSMTSTHIYAPAVGRASHVLQSLSIHKGKKRQRSAEDGDESESDDESQFIATAKSEDGRSRASSKSRAESYASFTANQLEQFRTAGLEPGDDIPKAPFPHRSASPPRNALLEVQAELQELNPPLAHVDPIHFESVQYKANNDRESLRNRHLGVLITIMHSMLAKQDFQRAGKAWGLLLRSGYMSWAPYDRTGDQAMDVRTNGRWGIGAEILMRGGFEEPSPIREEQADGTTSQPDECDREFSEEGFQKARQYYERLIVQYPEHHRRKGPKAGSFYAAMFSLWIYEVNEKSRRAQLKVKNDGAEERKRAKPKKPLSMPRNRHTGGVDDILTPAEELLLDNIKSKEQDGAEEIAARMDGVVLTPPFDKNAELLQLRGMVALWVADLTGDRTGGIETARQFFQKSQENGGRRVRDLENSSIIGEE